MANTFVDREWHDLCERVKQSAEYYAEQSPDDGDRFRSEAEEFGQREPPELYRDFLQVVRDAAELAKSWQEAVPGPGISQPETAKATCDETDGSSEPAAAGTASEDSENADAN